MLNGLDLFSGIGGITYALMPWVRPLAYCERDAYCQAVLLSRMAAGDIPKAPIWDDVCTLDGRQFHGEIDIIYGGFPCQDISVAGLGHGLEGERSGLFREILRLADEIEPAMLFLENVPAITGRGLATVAREISARGYDCRWDIVSAQDVGAPHLRKRWWLLAAHASRLDPRVKQGRSGGKKWKGAAELGDHGATKSLANTDGRRFESKRESERPELQSAPGNISDRCGREEIVADPRGGRLVQSKKRKGEQPRRAETFGCGSLGDADGAGLEIGQSCENREEQPTPFGTSWWAVEPDVGRVVNGIPDPVDRVRALGNSVVPAAAREAFQRLCGMK